jgi:hypothetical protein
VIRPGCGENLPGRAKQRPREPKITEKNVTALRWLSWEEWNIGEVDAA